MKSLPISFVPTSKLPTGETLQRFQNGASTITTPEGLTKVFDKTGRLVLQTIQEGGKKVLEEVGSKIDKMA